MIHHILHPFHINTYCGETGPARDTYGYPDDCPACLAAIRTENEKQARETNLGGWAFLVYRCGSVVDVLFRRTDVSYQYPTQDVQIWYNSRLMHEILGKDLNDPRVAPEAP